MRAQKEPTSTALVEEALRASDDFMSVDMLVAATGRSRNQVGAACHHLRRFLVVDVVVNPDGRGWWFAMPHDGDTRSRVVEERTPESRPRRQRRRKARD